jgi:hypothetical protein
MKAYWGSGDSSTHSLTSALDGGEWWDSRPGLFTPRERVPWYPLDRRLGGPQSRSGRGGKEKNSQLRQDSNPRSSFSATSLKYPGFCLVKHRDNFNSTLL